jgi:hypothetical protein
MTSGILQAQRNSGKELGCGPLFRDQHSDRKQELHAQDVFPVFGFVQGQAQQFRADKFPLADPRNEKLRCPEGIDQIAHDAPRWPAVRLPQCHRLREVPFHNLNTVADRMSQPHRLAHDYWHPRTSHPPMRIASPSGHVGA